MIKLLSIILLFSVSYSTSYTNCNFKNDDYEKICKKLVIKNVDVNYVNHFLLSNKASIKDEKTLRFLSPKKIKYLNKREKKANNNLVKFIPQVKKHLKKYKKVYDLSEQRFNVNREITAAILLKETKLGTYTPRHDSFVTLNTIIRYLPSDSKRNKRLRKLAHNNIVSLIDYCYKNDLSHNECSFKSSYIGAVGISQFMPINFKLIVPYKGSFSKLDNLPDAIMSTSNFLNKTSKFNKLINWNKIPDMKKIENQWYDFDFTNKKASFAFDGKYNCFSCDNKELDYLRNYVLKIMKYNKSSNYAIGVLRIAYDSSL